jgi:hypothetical protein
MKPELDRPITPSFDPDRNHEFRPLPLNDAGAADAIARLKSDEAAEDYIVIEPPIWGGPPWGGTDPYDPTQPPPWDPSWPPPIFPEPPFPPTVIPTGNQLTGQELLGYLLEGVMDPGNERNELQQFQALRFDGSVKPDPAAQRVLDVVDRWVGKLQSEGRTALTPEEKAQMTTEMAEAAKPRESDHALPPLPDPWPPFPPEPWPTWPPLPDPEPWPPVIVNGFTESE